MIDKVESFMTRLRWKAYFFKKPDQLNSNNSTNFGFKSNVIPPQNEKLTSFENGLYDMVQSIEFKSVRNNFQSTLRKELNKIKSSRNLLVFTDKITNLYEMPPDQYKTLSSTITLQRRIARPIPMPNKTSTKKPKDSPKN